MGTTDNNALDLHSRYNQPRSGPVPMCGEGKEGRGEMGLVPSA